MSNYPDDFNSAAYELAYGGSERLTDDDAEDSARILFRQLEPIIKAHILKEYRLTLQDKKFDGIEARLTEALTEEIKAIFEYVELY